MPIANIRQSFHQLIDKIDNETVLTQFYTALQENASKSFIWDKLDKEQQLEILSSYAESEQTEQILEEPSIEEKYKQWLSK